jgi:hypothetical protein
MKTDTRDIFRFDYERDQKKSNEIFHFYLFLPTTVSNI